MALIEDTAAGIELRKKRGHFQLKFAFRNARSHGGSTGYRTIGNRADGSLVAASGGPSLPTHTCLRPYDKNVTAQPKKEKRANNFLFSKWSWFNCQRNWSFLGDSFWMTARLWLTIYPIKRDNAMLCFAFLTIEFGGDRVVNKTRSKKLRIVLFPVVRN